MSSIYQTIVTAREAAPSLPYTFQNHYVAGRMDTLSILLSEGISYQEKEERAVLCSNLLLSYLKSGYDKEPEELIRFLKEHSIRDFFMELRDRLQALLDEGIIERSPLNQLAMTFAKESAEEEVVKVGIVLLSLAPSDLGKKVLKVLGYHSSFTLYVADSFRSSGMKSNQELFDLLKNTAGFGRLAALFLFRPVKEEQQQWILEEGVKSPFLSNLYVSLALQKADFRQYLYDLELTESNYAHVLYLLAYHEMDEARSLEDEMVQFMARVVEARNFSSSFIDIAGLVTIWLQMVDSWKLDYQTLHHEVDEHEPLTPYWDERFNQYEESIRSIESFLNHSKWKQLIKLEMDNPKEADYLLIQAIQFLNMEPEMGAFLPMLKRNPLGMRLLDFFLRTNPERYFIEVCSYLEQLLSEDLFQLPLEAEEMTEVGDQAKATAWLTRLLTIMIEKDLYDEDWCITSLYHYQPLVRRLALLAINKYQDQWQDEDEIEHALDELDERETNQKNILLLQQLLVAGTELAMKKHYVTVQKPITETSPEDVLVLKSYVQDLRYHDVQMIDHVLRYGQLLQLVRVPRTDGKEDVVQITFQDGYVVGCVPRPENRLIAALLSHGEQLYGIFKGPNENPSDASLSLYLKKTPPKLAPEQNRSTTNIVPFPKGK